MLINKIKEKYVHIPQELVLDYRKEGEKKGQPGTWRANSYIYG